MDISSLNISDLTEDQLSDLKQQIKIELDSRTIVYKSPLNRSHNIGDKVYFLNIFANKLFYGEISSTKEEVIDQNVQSEKELDEILEMFKIKESVNRSLILDLEYIKIYHIKNYKVKILASDEYMEISPNRESTDRESTDRESFFDKSIQIKNI